MEAPFTYIESFIPDHANWFERLRAELAWVQREGTPRQEYWANHDDRSYTYGSGRGVRTYEAQPAHALIDAGRALLQEHHDVQLQGCFLNKYPTSRDHLGWHSDDDPGIEHSKPIAVITLGAGRPIRFRTIPVERRKPGEYDFELMLAPGSLVLMHAGSQYTHQHMIPKLGHDVGARISMTYRGLVEQ